ncbi:RNA binding domain protein [Aspergillus clavatus NRRL 1]|uniref:RNA binding domain protein n=1 Tax=Aspergillus clavatus (strain ATCC 1007 / CBS 513.65 / DSM 816 / NCTC 3887 / NRRL 1 / QM 1276 / 107) TaxID=344612 RepID=A1CBX6_ASPCL|nr:RNA binding domain protein [Aspergillus clavatus NRRL 1]EAW13244.1 RNA binding domain protein [Aspergillus clavatus NRRL 1]
MSGKLDKSLDEILVNRRQNARRRTRRPAASKPGSASVPVGGVKKNAKPTKPTAKGVQGGHPVSSESKIMVSGLPSDVNEGNIKEYFTKSAGPVKRVMLTYNQNGTSRGIASIVFSKPDTAAKAAKDLNGLLVDGRPMKIEVVVDASHAPSVPAPKPLGERVAQVKSQPKPATAAKTAAAARGRGRRGRRGGAAATGRTSNRPKQKTVEELDAEMVDYFAGNENAGSADASAPAAANGAAQQPAAGGEDLGMAEISIVYLPLFLK